MRNAAGIISSGGALLVLLMIASTGCSSGEPVEKQVAVEAVTEEVPAPAAEAVQAKLRLADLADGEADKVVTLCAGCALGMKGSPDHALEVQGYEMHFCSDSCKKPFAEAGEAAIVALEIVEEPPVPEMPGGGGTEG